MCGIAGALAFTDGFAVDEAHRRADDRHAPPPRSRRRRERSSGREDRVGSGPPAAVDRRPLAPPATSRWPTRTAAVWITYNGEVYNHAALRTDLEARGHRYRSHTDTETILHLYEEEGPACVERARRHVRVRDLGRAPRRAAARARPARRQAAVLRARSRAASCSAPRSRRCSSTRRVPPRARRGGVRRLPDVRVHAAAADDVPGVGKLGPGERMTVQRDGGDEHRDAGGPDAASRSVERGRRR